MGSFNMACSLTGLSISCGDPAVIVICEAEKRYKNKLNTYQAGWANFEDSAWFPTVILPIFGTYEDYGELSFSLDNNPHLKNLNTKYKIEDLLTYVTRPDGLDSDSSIRADFPEGLYAVWIHGQVWKEVINWHDTHTNIGNLWPTPVVLTQLGFTQTELIEHQRYNRLYTHPNWNGYAIGSDGYFGQFFVKKDNSWIEEYTCTLKDIIKTAKKYKLPLDLSKIQKPFRIISILDEISKIKEECEWHIHKDNITYQELFNRKNYYSNPWYFITSSRSQNNNFARLFGTDILEGNTDIIEMTSQLKIMREVFHSCNRLFAPPIAGPQCGDYQTTKFIGQLTTQLSNQHLRKYK